jgi:glycosyltransferase involved in cell wall biosynthesis
LNAAEYALECSLNRSKITSDNAVFILLSFEGPDAYSFAGGLGIRMTHLSNTLADMRFPTQLFFIGDPRLEAEETLKKGKLVLRRWCQWISNYYPEGVYHGENEKLCNFNDSVPEFIAEHIVKPAAKLDKIVIILGEEWQTAEAMSRIHKRLHDARIRDRAIMFWNANNTFGFERVNWEQLKSAATLTTVSRYMKHIMWRMNLNPLVIPNGIPKALLRAVDERKTNELKDALDANVVLSKVARWHTDKSWKEAVEATAQLRDMGLRTVLVARGGTEPYGEEVCDHARSFGLKVEETTTKADASGNYVSALREAAQADVINVRCHLPQGFLRILYRASQGVLANSAHEPFGLVGLEAMAAGGVAFTGCTGEDYTIPFVNSFVLETTDPAEITSYVRYLEESPEEEKRIRKAARRTARNFTWEAVVQNLLSKLDNQARVQGILKGQAKPAPLPQFEVNGEGERFPADSSIVSSYAVARD